MTTHICSQKVISEVTHFGTLVSNFKFENGSNEIEAKPLEKVTASVTFNIQPRNGAREFLKQIIVGVEEVAQAFILSERRVIGRRFEGMMGVDHKNKVYENDSDYLAKFNLNVPRKPGTYLVKIGFLGFNRKRTENPGTINGFSELFPADKARLESNEALDDLWKDKKIFKVTIGKIHVY